MFHFRKHSTLIEENYFIFTIKYLPWGNFLLTFSRQEKFYCVLPLLLATLSYHGSEIKAYFLFVLCQISDYISSLLWTIFHFSFSSFTDPIIWAKSFISPYNAKSVLCFLNWSGFLAIHLHKYCSSASLNSKNIAL